VTVFANYPTESIFAFRKPSVDRSVGNNPFRFHPYLQAPKVGYGVYEGPGDVVAGECNHYIEKGSKNLGSAPIDAHNL
jgi:hypothetical protein